MNRTEFEALPAYAQVAEILRVMADVVSEFGNDYEYPGVCQYVCLTNDAEPSIYGIEAAPDHWLKPDCIVGQVLSRLGWDLRVMAKENTEYIHIASWAGNLSGEARKVLEVAQSSQDNRMPASLNIEGDKRWSTALLRAQGAAAALFN